MPHYPNCPNYRKTSQCTCHLAQPVTSRSETATLPPRALCYHDPLTAPSAIQSTRLVRRAFARAPTDVCAPPHRSVHFDPPRLQHQLPPAPPRCILRTSPDQPTIHIVTFATDSFPNNPACVSALLASQVPPRAPPVPHLYTIDARGFTPPGPRDCELYSGISPLLQDVVLQDRNARRAVERAVADLIAFGVREGREREVCMSVCCTAGTHRSVAIGERIAQGVKGEVRRLGAREGVKVVVRHVSRIKGRGDPF
jgi:hypothetical protein